MKNLILTNYKLLYSNQCRLKFLKSNVYYNFLINSFALSTAYTKLESIKNNAILETLYFFKLISNKKSYISYYKKKYKEVDLSISLNVLEKNGSYFFLLLTIFFIPMILQKETLFKPSFLKGKYLNITVNSYNFYPLIPSIFYTYTKKFIIKIIFSSYLLNENKLILSYYKINKHLMK